MLFLNKNESLSKNSRSKEQIQLQKIRTTYDSVFSLDELNDSVVFVVFYAVRSIMLRSIRLLTHILARNMRLKQQKLQISFSLLLLQ